MPISKSDSSCNWSKLSYADLLYIHRFDTRRLDKEFYLALQKKRRELPLEEIARISKEVGTHGAIRGLYDLRDIP